MKVISKFFCVLFLDKIDDIFNGVFDLGIYMVGKMYDWMGFY